MNALTFSWASITARPLQSALCILASAAGITLLTLVFLLWQAASSGFTRNADGIDLVVGAKGSPLQLVLSSVYHADVPVANIDEKAVDEITRNPRVKSVVPLTLGDNHNGFRIVGTTPAYIGLYKGRMAQGQLFAAPFEAVAGSGTGLKIGDTFPAVHGFAGDGDDVHHFHDYKVVGVLHPTGTVIDRLIVTSIDSVHEMHTHPDLGDPDAAEEMAMGHQVTSMLVKVRSPLDKMNLPRSINRSDDVMAASPSYEIARLASTLGVGRDVLAILGGGFVVLSALMLLSSMASNLVNRRYDLAVLRVLGASRTRLFLTILSEGVFLSFMGAVIGILLGHGIGFYIARNAPVLIDASLFIRLGWSDAAFLLLGVMTGALGALFPAISAAKTDIADLLARGRA